MKRGIWLILGMLVMAGGIADADIPKTITYQGRLMDAAGKAVADASNYVVIINLYDSLQSTVLWTKTYNGVTTKNGYFSLTLGDTTPQWTGLTFDQQYYVGTQIGGDPTELLPRQALGAVPYAMNVADNAVGTAKLQANAVTGAKVADNAIATAKIADGAVKGTDIASATITSGNIANGAIDSQAKAPWAPRVFGYGNYINNPKIIFGSVTSGADGKAYIVFPANYFSITPSISVTSKSNGSGTDKFFSNIQDESSSGFTINTYAHWSDMTQSGPQLVYWIAIGY